MYTYRNDELKKDRLISELVDGYMHISHVA